MAEKKLVMGASVLWAALFLRRADLAFFGILITVSRSKMPGAKRVGEGKQAILY